MVNYYVGVIRHQKMMEVGASGQGFPQPYDIGGIAFPQAISDSAIIRRI